MSKWQLREQIRAAYETAGRPLGREVTDENAVPAYLDGGRLSRHVFWRKLDLVIAAAALRPAGRVLDFGCGTGVLLPRLASEGRSVLATDLRPQIAQQLVCQLQLSGVSFIPAEDWDTHVADGSLDALIAANVLEHIDDRRPLLSRMAAKLRPAGRLVISGPTENTLYRFGRWLIGFSGHYHVANVHDVLDDVTAVGFRCVTRRRYPLPGPGCLYVVAGCEPPAGSGCSPAGALIDAMEGKLTL